MQARGAAWLLGLTKDLHNPAGAQRSSHAKPPMGHPPSPTPQPRLTIFQEDAEGERQQHGTGGVAGHGRGTRRNGLSWQERGLEDF